MRAEPAATLTGPLSFGCYVRAGTARGAACKEQASLERQELGILWCSHNEIRLRVSKPLPSDVLVTMDGEVTVAPGDAMRCDEMMLFWWLRGLAPTSHINQLKKTI